MKKAKQILSECFLGVIDFNEAAALAAMGKYAKQQVRISKKKTKNASKFVQSIANKVEYIDGGQYNANKYRNLAIPVIEWNELIELADKYDKKLTKNKKQ